MVVAYLAFFQDVRDIPQSADAYSDDIRSLHDQLWTISDIHGQIAKLMASNENVRISDVHLQSRLRQGQLESLKEARKFLDEYSATYQDVFSNYYHRRRWLVRVKWLLLQRKVDRFRAQASDLLNALILDLLAINLNMNIAIVQSLHGQSTGRGSTTHSAHEHDTKTADSQAEYQTDSPSPGAERSAPFLSISPPSRDPSNGPRRAVSRSHSPFSSSPEPVELTPSLAGLKKSSPASHRTLPFLSVNPPPGETGLQVDAPRGRSPSPFSPMRRRSRSH